MTETGASKAAVPCPVERRFAKEGTPHPRCGQAPILRRGPPSILPFLRYPAHQHCHTPPTNAWRRRRAVISESRVVSQAALDSQFRNSKGGAREAPAAESSAFSAEKLSLAAHFAAWFCGERRGCPGASEANRRESGGGESVDG